MAQVSEQMAALKHAVEQVGALSVSARSADGLVQVDVGAQGELRGLWLDDSVCDRVPPEKLGEVITGLVRQAAAEAAERAREIMGPVLPGSLPAGQEWWQWLPDWAKSAGGSGGPVW